jgi:hypothetical protein
MEKKMPKEKRNLVVVSHHNLQKFLIVPYHLQILRLHICIKNAYHWTQASGWTFEIAHEVAGDKSIKHLLLFIAWPMTKHI